MPDMGTAEDHIEDLMAVNKQLRQDRERLAERVTVLEDTNAVLRAELKRVTEELARRYE